MAFFNSKISTFELYETGGPQRDISVDINEISGLPGQRNLSEVTALPDTGTKWIPGLENVQITLAGLFSDTTGAGGDALLGVLRTATAAVDFEYGPEGNSAGDMMYTGTCWVTDYQITSRVGNTVAWRATLQVEGVVTRAAHA